MSLLDLSTIEMASYIEPRLVAHDADEISLTPDVDRTNEIYDQITEHMESAAAVLAVELTITPQCRDRNDELFENRKSYSDFESQLSDALVAAHELEEWAEVKFIASTLDKVSTAYSNLLDAVDITRRGSLTHFRGLLAETN